MAGFLKNNKGPGKIGRKNDDLWTKTGTFINKPNRGWIHPDERLKVGGICYGVRYVGCLEVKQSMRTLPFDMRGQVTKEAIFRVCDAAGFRYNRKKKAGKQVNKVLGELPNIQFGGANVNLTISTVSINLMIMETGKTIANHQMQGISFASGGDVETPDYVAYIAKDPVNARACHVIECSDGLAHDVITTIGQAFEIRFKEYLKNPPQAVNVPDRFVSEESAWGEDPEYYNDLSDFVPKPVQKEPLPEIPVANGLELQTHTYIYQSSKPNDRPMSDGNVEGNDLYDNRTDVMNHNTTDPKIYDNKTSYENSKQPVIGQLIDLVEATPAPVFDNPLNQQSKEDSTDKNHTPVTNGKPHPILNNDIKQSELSKQPSTNMQTDFNKVRASLNKTPRTSLIKIEKDPDLSPAVKLQEIKCNLKPSMSERRTSTTRPKIERRTPSLYDNPPKETENVVLSPKSRFVLPCYENIKHPDLKQMVEAGYDNFRSAGKLNNQRSRRSSSKTQDGSASFESNSVNDWQNPNPTPHSDHYHHPTSVRSSLSGSPMSHSFDDSVYTGVPDRLLSSPVAMDTGVTEPFNPSPTGTGDLGVKPSVPLKEEIWFHGPMTRKQSEAKLEADGDFLVRESTTTPGQYVLSGMQSGTPKHLLLVDPEGKVRTKDKEFDSVSHLIDYHRSNKLPIISAGSAVHLKQPVISVEAGGR
ncbi:SHC-transforming protein 1-like isoform X2 [Anneissia japonica]|uniref:SHC-transforming protein 1-like isoform X2 n=1 Tax=Anneissia japonica TaxID=1529436 RepID=UPI0014259BB1|nr:SHC-transforming protein 1-like isoform X2 [Anneissia japonica]